MPIRAQTCVISQAETGLPDSLPCPRQSRFPCSPLAAKPGGPVPRASPPAAPRGLAPARSAGGPCGFLLGIFLVESAPLTHALIPPSRRAVIPRPAASARRLPSSRTGFSLSLLDSPLPSHVGRPRVPVLSLLLCHRVLSGWLHVASPVNSGPLRSVLPGFSTRLSVSSFLSSNAKCSSSVLSFSQWQL